MGGVTNQGAGDCFSLVGPFGGDIGGGFVPPPPPTDTTAPTITSPSTASTPENAAWSMGLTADEEVSWSLVAGQDTALFTLSGATISLPAKDYEAGKTTFATTVRATDTAGNFTDQPFTLTLTNVLEVTLGALTLAPTDGTAGTAYTGTITGKTSGSTITATSSDGAALTVSGTSVTGTRGPAGTPTVTLTETHPDATNSGRTSTVTFNNTAVVVQPTTFTDNFNRADENLQASPNWTNVDGAANAMVVRSGQLAAQVATESTFLSPDLGSPNAYVEGTLALVGANGPFLLVRAVNLSNWLGVRNNASAYNVFKRVGGTLTGIGNGSVTPAVGDRIRLEVNGDVANLYINGVLQGPGTNMALGGDLAGVTRQGVIARTAARNPWIDDYKAGTL